MTFKELRKNAKLTVSEVAEKLKRKTNTIYSYENSQRLPSFAILSQMASVYKVSLEEIKATYDYHKARMKGEKTVEDEIVEILSGVSESEKKIILNNALKKLSD